MGIFKWVLVLFGALALGLVVLSKALAFLNPARPGQPEPLLLARTRRALRWAILFPALLGLAILAATVLR